jgi:8-oxo-dGTP pyrophosphatase MutT (NUDIX family)/RimJ/RimL family protein N-acetyltransferase
MAGEVARTWDGLDRALDDPHGSTVVVRRTHPTEGPQFLLLHRAVNGPNHEGDWAWTSPAGCRLPGEPVYPGALRELSEEAGIDGYDVWAVDLTQPAPDGYQWAVFALDLHSQVAVTLTDPEHDRFEWLSAEEALRRVRPDFVADVQVRRLRDVPPARTAFRPMAEDDLPRVAQWWRTPHARPWFHGDNVTDDEVAARLGPRLRGEVPTRMWVYQVDGVPVGYAQTYRVGDHPEYAAKTRNPDAAAFDYLLGEPDLVGRGLGTRMVWELCRDVLRREHPDAVHHLASPSHRNAASLRVLEKCGFKQGLWIDELVGPQGQPDTEIVCTLDVRHYLG